VIGALCVPQVVVDQVHGDVGRDRITVPDEELAEADGPLCWRVQMIDHTAVVHVERGGQAGRSVMYVVKGTRSACRGIGGVTTTVGAFPGKKMARRLAIVVIRAESSRTLA
jgi:hypothetical protein